MSVIRLIALALLFSWPAQAEEGAEPPDFILKVPLIIENLHENVEDVVVTCQVSSAEEQVEVSKGFLGVGPINETLEIPVTVRHTFAPDRAREARCYLNLVIAQGDDTFTASYRHLGPRSQYQQDDHACQVPYDHHLRPTCSRAGTTRTVLVVQEIGG